MFRISLRFPSEKLEFSGNYVKTFGFSFSVCLNDGSSSFGPSECKVVRVEVSAKDGYDVFNVNLNCSFNGWLLSEALCKLSNIMLGTWHSDWISCYVIFVIEFRVWICIKLYMSCQETVRAQIVQHCNSQILIDDSSEVFQGCVGSPQVVRGWIAWPGIVRYGEEGILVAARTGNSGVVKCGRYEGWGSGS